MFLRAFVRFVLYLGPDQKRDFLYIVACRFFVILIIIELNSRRERERSGGTNEIEIETHKMKNGKCVSYP